MCIRSPAQSPMGVDSSGTTNQTASLVQAWINDPGPG